MKKFFAFSLCFITLLTACKDDNATSGSAVLPDEDGIVVNVDTFSLTSMLRTADYIYSTPDSFLLGECEDERFGIIHADILAQMACPVGFQFPQNAEVDSLCLFLYYNTWFGDGKSPLQLSVYEMDKATFNYAEPYPMNLPLSDYCSLGSETRIVEKGRIITAAQPTDSLYVSSTQTYVPYIRFKATDAFTQRFFSNLNLSSQNAFNEQFKGLYITSEFGSATVLHIFNINMSLYYHYSYPKNGKDTTVNDIKGFYANSEVRQINRVEYRNQHFDDLIVQEDSINYIVSPANIYTRLSIPMQEMSQHIVQTVGTRRPYVNQAKLTIDVLNKYTGSTADKTVEDWTQPAEQMMLIKEDALTRFFEKKELPTDTCALLSALSSGTDTIGNTIYYYSYDLSSLLTRQLREDTHTDTLQMVLVPVSVASTSSSSGSTVITSVRPQQTISATTIRSAQSADNPMQLNVIYSGF